MKKLVVCLLALAPLSALAGSATVSWTLPTQYTDNSVLVPTDIATTKVDYGICPLTTVTGTATVTGAGLSTVINNLNPGNWCFRAYVTVIAAKGGGTSAFSMQASKVVPFPDPKPPTIVDVILAWLKAHWHRMFA